MLRAINRAHLHDRGRVVYLRSTPEEVFRRVRHDRNRPLLQVADPLQRLRDLYAVRDPLYRETAHIIMPTEGGSARDVAMRIIHALEARDALE